MYVYIDQALLTLADFGYPRKIWIIWYSNISVLSVLITGFLTRVTRREPLVEQELPTFPEHASLPGL